MNKGKGEDTEQKKRILTPSRLRESHHNHAVSPEKLSDREPPGWGRGLLYSAIS